MAFDWLIPCSFPMKLFPFFPPPFLTWAGFPRFPCLGVVGRSSADSCGVRTGLKGRYVHFKTLRLSISNFRFYIHVDLQSQRPPMTVWRKVPFSGKGWRHPDRPEEHGGLQDAADQAISLSRTHSPCVRLRATTAAVCLLGKGRIIHGFINRFCF